MEILEEVISNLETYRGVDYINREELIKSLKLAKKQLKAINYSPCCKSDSEQLVLFSRFMSNNSKKAAYMTSTELLEEFKKQN